MVQSKSCDWVTEQSDWCDVSISRLHHWCVDQHSACGLPLWRVSLDVPVSASDVLSHLCSVPGAVTQMNSTVSRWKTLARPRDDVDLVQYAVSIPHALDRTRCFHVIR